MKRQLRFLVPALLAVILLPHTLGGSPSTRSALVGKWNGRVSSVNFSSFAVTIEIGPDSDSKAHLVGEGSPCFAEADLAVTITGPNSVNVAGRRKAGETIILKEILDSSEKQLDVTYITNGSASARCETDQGAGTLDKQ